MFDFDAATVTQMGDAELAEMRRNVEGWIEAYGETAKEQYVDRAYDKLLIVEDEQDWRAFEARESEKARDRECLHMPNMHLPQGGYWHNA